MGGGALGSPLEVFACFVVCLLLIYFMLFVYNGFLSCFWLCSHGKVEFTYNDDDDYHPHHPHYLLAFCLSRKCSLCCTRTELKKFADMSSTVGVTVDIIFIHVDVSSSTSWEYMEAGAGVLANIPMKNKMGIK